MYSTFSIETNGIIKFYKWNSDTRRKSNLDEN